ncbi:MAG TPA: P1 family peptidase, partial [Micrococcaceae bacterium]|nr:P1 family peptidase [Micrococcaceae bacterium]
MTEQTGSITDVPGIRVGQVHRTDTGWLSGVTVVLPPPGSIGAVDVRGGGPGTHETDALDPTTLVPTVDAVVLTGGSAYGLAAATGVQQWCEEEGRGFPVSGGVVPIVPAAAIFDLGRGGDFRARPGAEMGYLAAQAAGACGEYDDVARGNAGAGTGAALGRGTFKGGTGTASRTLRGANASVVVGA